MWYLINTKSFEGSLRETFAKVFVAIQPDPLNTNLELIRE
jgi:hypothetical protein